VVGTAATRGLHRSSMSKVNWEGKGPSPPLGGAIVDSRGLLIVMIDYRGFQIYLQYIGASMAERIYMGSERGIKGCGFGRWYRNKCNIRSKWNGSGSDVGLDI
jgi:hypothetical protein